MLLVLVFVWVALGEFDGRGVVAEVDGVIGEVVFEEHCGAA